MRIKKGDQVKIICGKDRSKQGRVERVLNKKQKIIVEGLNLQTKNARARRMGEKGQVVQYAAPLAVSNVRLVCPKCSKVTSVSYKGDAKTKTRICKKCQAEI